MRRYPTLRTYRRHYLRAARGARTAAVSAARSLGLPRAASVGIRAGRPCAVNGETVEAVRESWLVEDRWWTGRPLRRRYWEIVGVKGRNLVIFRDLVAGGWFVQGA